MGMFGELRARIGGPDVFLRKQGAAFEEYECRWCGCVFHMGIGKPLYCCPSCATRLSVIEDRR